MGIFLELWNVVADECAMIYLTAVIGPLRPRSRLLAHWFVKRAPTKAVLA